MFDFNRQPSASTFPSETLRSLELEFPLEIVRPPDFKTLNTWAGIVGFYTECQLTKETDKLVAISAIARAMKPLMTCRYLAGLWEKDLVKQLGWSLGDGGGRRPTKYRAPSWSWASVEGHCEPRKLSKVARPLIEVRSAHVDLASDDEMGPVEGGYLDVTGQLFSLGRNSDRNDPNLQIPGFDVSFQLLRDCSLMDIEGPLHLLPLTVANPPTYYRYEKYNYVIALVLQQHGLQACYQRVGCVQEAVSFSQGREHPFTKMLGDFKEVGKDRKFSLWSFSRNDSRMQHLRLV